MRAISKRMWMPFRRALFLSLCVYLGLGAILFVFQSKYIYYPDKTDFQDCDSFKDAKKISYGSSRGYLSIRSLEKVVVFYHGNAGRACDRDYLDSFFAEQDYSTYFVEYSGYGERGDVPSMPKLLKNVEDTIGFLKTQDFRHVAVIGESLGTGPAAYHASLSKVDNLVLIAAYDALSSVAFSHYPVYPMRLLLLDDFTPSSWLASYKDPVSVILAENDTVIPSRLGRKLYGDIPSKQKKIHIVDGAGHNTLHEREEFYSALKSALR